MIAELLFVASCVLLSIYKRESLGGTISITIFTVNELSAILPVDDFIYNTILITSYSLIASKITSPIIKSALLILASDSVVTFILNILDLFYYNDLTWIWIISWASLYDYVYYSTIILILAGLAKSDHGGIRNNSASYRLLFNDNNSVDFKRI